MFNCPVLTGGALFKSMNIFIDIGARQGESTRAFLAKNKDYQCHLFECDNENLKELQGGDNMIINPAAAWIIDGEIVFYYGTSHGGSINETKITGKVNPGKSYKVKAIDIARYIKTKFKQTDHIVVKMNCEGAEYDIIPHMIKHGLNEWVNQWYVCWHYHKLKNISEQKHKEVSSMIKSVKWKR